MNKGCILGADYVSLLQELGVQQYQSDEKIIL
jgi:hypothetical protein